MPRTVRRPLMIEAMRRHLQADTVDCGQGFDLMVLQARMARLGFRVVQELLAQGAIRVKPRQEGLKLR